MDWVSILQGFLIFVGHQLMRLTLGDVPKLISGFIAVWFQYFWTSPESEPLRRFLGPIVVDLANNLFVCTVLYFGYDFMLLLGGYLRAAHDYAAAPLLRRVFGVKRIRATPEELECTIRSFRARVHTKLEALKGKVENHPHRDRLVEKITRIQLQIAEMLNPESAQYKDLCVRHIDTCLQILNDDVSDLIRGNSHGMDLGVLNNDHADLTAKINTVKQNLQQGTPPASPYWPSFYPFNKHNIANEIPLHLQKLQCAAFATWLGIIACLFWNIIAMTTAWIGGEGGLAIWLYAILYFTVGAPASYLLSFVVPSTVPNFKRMTGIVYFLRISDSPDTSLISGWFLKYMIHIIFSFVAALGPPSLTGIFTSINVSGNYWVANLYLVGFQMFLIEAFLSIWVLMRVCQQFPDAWKRLKRVCQQFPGAWASR